MRPRRWIGCARSCFDWRRVLDVIRSDPVRYGLGASVLCRTLDGDQLVYVADRFDTHLIDPAAALVVTTLLSSVTPLTLTELRLQLLGAEVGLDDDPGVTLADNEALRGLLVPLVRAGIVVEQSD